MHYFHNLSSASEVFAPRPPPGLYPWTPLGDFCPETPNLPTPGKNPAGAHASRHGYGEDEICSACSILGEPSIKHQSLIAHYGLACMRP